MNEKDIRKLIKIVEETGINEIEVTKWWGHKVKVVKSGGAGTLNIPPQNNSVAAAPVEQQVETAAPAEEVENNNHTEVKSPMVGTFYRAPAPEEPAFVSVGDTVRTGQTLCIIEAMKVMNEIEAEVSGKVVEILVENANPVEFNQKLFLIDESQ